MLKVEKNNENRTSGKVGHNWRFRITKQVKKINKQIKF